MDSTIGHYPQVQEVADYDYSSNRSYLNIKWNELPDFTPDLRAQMNPNAVRTNLIGLLSIGYGLCVNSTMNEILSKHSLSDHKTYPVSLEHGNEELNYHFFHCINSFLPYIDWSKTEFEHFRKSRFEILKDLKFDSISQLNDFKRKLTFEFGIRVKKIMLNDQFPMYDFVSLWGVVPQFLVSDRLLSEFRENELTGFNHRVYDLLEIDGINNQV